MPSTLAAPLLKPCYSDWWPQPDLTTLFLQHWAQVYLGAAVPRTLSLSHNIRRWISGLLYRQGIKRYNYFKAPHPDHFAKHPNLSISSIPNTRDRHM